MTEIIMSELAGIGDIIIAAGIVVVLIWLMQPITSLYKNWCKYENLRTAYKYALYMKKVEDSGIEIDEDFSNEKRIGAFERDTIDANGDN